MPSLSAFCYCDGRGSLTQTCDPVTGQCKCLHGFAGKRCDKCAKGHYDFPRCRACNCHPGGTLDAHCDQNGKCECDNSGACACKAHASGRKCASCKRGTFGLDVSHPEGCLQCFCFERSRICEQAKFANSQIVFSRQWTLIIRRGRSQLSLINGLAVLPSPVRDNEGNYRVIIGVTSIFTKPLYWQLPRLFHGDRVTSYNGFLRFMTESDGSLPYAPDILQEFPLVQISGNGIVLEHFPRDPAHNGFHQIRLHEDHWVNRATSAKVSRSELLLLLQKVDQILIRSSDSTEANVIRLRGVYLDFATPTDNPNAKLAIGVEQCVCPPEYSGSSCQRPGSGYSRVFASAHLVTRIEHIIGSARKCECNNRASKCDPETGRCIDCSNNSAGPKCELCAQGFFGDPDKGCKPCNCPGNGFNFAITCNEEYNNDDQRTSCQCRDGHTGPRCERCIEGYYGSPEIGQGCQRCQCNALGSHSNKCHPVSGQCSCKEGVSGRDCSICPKMSVLSTKALDKTCLKCSNNTCVKDLLMDITAMELNPELSKALENERSKGVNLNSINNRLQEMRRNKEKVDEQEKSIDNLYSETRLIRPRASLTAMRGKELLKESQELKKKAKILKSNGIFELDNNKELEEDILSLQNRLKNSIYTRSRPSWPWSTSSNSATTLHEMKIILKELQRRNSNFFLPKDMNSRRALSKAKQTLRSVNNLLYGYDEAVALRGRTERLQPKIEHLLNVLNDVMANTHKSFRKNMRLKQKLAKVSAAIAESFGRHDNGQKLLVDGQQMLDKAEQNLRESTKRSLYPLEVLIVRMETARQLLENRHNNGSVNDARAAMLKCREHSYDLIEKANDMIKLKESKLDSNVIRAANVYNEIVRSVNNASKEANEALAATEQYRALPPPSTMAKQASLKRARANDLLQESKGLKENSDSMGKRMEMITKDKKHEKSKLRHLNRRAKRLDIKSKLLFHNRRNYNELDNNDEASSQISMEIEQKLSEMRPKLREWKRDVGDVGTRSRLDVGPALIQAQRAGLGCSRRLNYLRKRSKEINDLQQKVAEQLRRLEQGVKRARHAAAGVKIAIKSDRKAPCRRSFRMKVGPGARTDVRLVLGLESPERTGLLLSLNSSEEFMALELIENRIRLVFNTGSGQITSLTHNTTLLNANSLLEEPQKWYLIEAQRFGHIGRLNVRPLKQTFNNYQSVQSVEGSIDSQALNEVGVIKIGLEETQLKEGLKSKGNFVGTIANLRVNDQNVGLWNFLQDNNHCLAADVANIDDNNGHEVSENDFNCFLFNGRGYAVQKRQLINFKPHYLGISFEIKTWDYNALLLLMVSKKENQWLKLSISEGRLVLDVNYDNKGTNMRFETNHTYNNYVWTHVEAARAIRGGKETVVLRVSSTEHSEELMQPLLTPYSNIQAPLLNMKECTIYVGGLPPNSDIFGKITKNQRKEKFPINFLGQMRHLSISNPGFNGIINPLAPDRRHVNEYYGVERRCHEEVVSNARLNGGFIEVIAKELKGDRDTLSLTFETKEENGDIFVLNNEDKKKENIIAYLSEGRLIIIIDGVQRFVSDQHFNDALPHTLSLVRMQQEIWIIVDDVELSKIKLKNRNFINDNNNESGVSKGKLVLGKSREGFEGVIGNIRDVVFTGDQSTGLVKLNEALTVRDCDIGRTMIFKRTRFDHNDYNDEYSSSCKSSRAMKSSNTLGQFSRALNSSVNVKFADEDIFNNDQFQLTIEVRTFDQDGLILSIPGSTKALSLYLQDGVLRLEQKGNFKRELQHFFFNDGHFHKLRILKRFQEILLFLDERLVMSIEGINDLKLKPNLQIGGFNTVTEVDHYNDDMTSFAHLSGCVGSLSLDSKDIRDLDVLISYNEILKCFSSVERGLYFEDGFTVVNHYFEADDFELSLEYKLEHEGNLVLLNLGNLEMRVVVDQRRVLVVRDAGDHYDEVSVDLNSSGNNDNNCEGKNWHSLRVSVESGQLRLNVDSLPAALRQLGRRQGQHDRQGGRGGRRGGAVLYIGGRKTGLVPVFRGCVRNLRIDNQSPNTAAVVSAGKVVEDACPKYE